VRAGRAGFLFVRSGGAMGEACFDLRSMPPDRYAGPAARDCAFPW